ncbi:hypothetical protein F4677DRAFT_435437 [Hypoxylon crocopeplum]|nr:hypothetical protein F4677DRAFT_435437 [Hypoxylon crocopeplum]
MYFLFVAILISLCSGALTGITGSCDVRTNVCHANVDNSEQATCKGTTCTGTAKPCTIQIVAPIGAPERGKATCL